MPECKPKCSTKTITGVSIHPSSCHLNDVEVRCSEPADPGTIARINCRDRYERPNTVTKQQIISCGDNGIWSPQPETCSAICGEEAPEGTPYVIGGFQANITKVPWHVGIYKLNGEAYKLQCGGTIVNARVVVSAMHCFWHLSAGGPFEASLFTVAAGKELLEYDGNEQSAVQKFGVKHIFYDDGYNDITGK